MKCSELEARIFEFSEGKITGTEKEQYELHLQNCGSCSQMLSEIRSFEKQFQEELSEEVNPYLTEKIVSRIKNTEREQVSTLGKAIFRLAMVFIAGTLLGILLNTYLFKEFEETNTAIQETETTDDVFSGDENILSLNE